MWERNWTAQWEMDATYFRLNFGCLSSHYGMSNVFFHGSCVYMLWSKKHILDISYCVLLFLSCDHLNHKINFWPPAVVVIRRCVIVMLMNVGTCNATLLSRSESAHPVLLLSALKCGLSAQSERKVVTTHGKCVPQNRVFIGSTAVKYVSWGKWQQW